MFEIEIDLLRSQRTCREYSVVSFCLEPCGNCEYMIEARCLRTASVFRSHAQLQWRALGASDGWVQRFPSTLPIFAQLESQQDTAAAWEELWEELHHQSNVGVASYAAVPELVRIHRMGGATDWKSLCDSGDH